MPSPLFDFLFLVSVIVPMGMYILGLLLLMGSLVVRHWRETAVRKAEPAVAH